jgi:hypothetical protein
MSDDIIYFNFYVFMNQYKTIFKSITKTDLMESIKDEAYYLILNFIILIDLIPYYWLIHNDFTN